METNSKKIKMTPDYFINQQKVIFLLIKFGIWDLPPEIVYKILKEHVYIKPIKEALPIFCSARLLIIDEFLHD